MNIFLHDRVKSVFFNLYIYDSLYNRVTLIYLAQLSVETFDRIVRAELWKYLAERGISGELLRAIQSLYLCSQAAVRTREGETEWFEVKCGLRQ